MAGVWLTYPARKSLVVLLGFVIYKKIRQEKWFMKIAERSALLVIDIQQEDFREMREDNLNDPAWDCIRNAKRVLDVFEQRSCPSSRLKKSTGRTW